MYIYMYMYMYVCILYIYIWGYRMISFILNLVNQANLRVNQYHLTSDQANMTISTSRMGVLRMELGDGTQQGPLCRWRS